MKSMTGMGRSNGQIDGIHFRIEIRSINHRFCEINVRLPNRLSSLEIPIQQEIKKRISRGKIDVSIFEDRSTQASSNEKKAFSAYYAYLKNIQDETKIPGNIEIHHLLPNVQGWIQKETDTSLSFENLKPLLQQAIDDLDRMRCQEGDHLKSAIKSLLQKIRNTTQLIREKTLQTAQDFETRLQEKIQNKLKDFDKLDPQRLHTEVIFYLDRMDITEELQRAESHFQQAFAFFDNTKESIGRKLDFLLQEFNREFNTMASKSQDSQIAHWIVDIKADLEKIREQAQNIE